MAAVILLSTAATLTYALLPSTNVPPSSVPLGTLAGATAVNVLLVDAFARAIEQAHGTNAVLQHLPFAPAQSTGWHTHPGPNSDGRSCGGVGGSSLEHTCVLAAREEFIESNENEA